MSDSEIKKTIETAIREAVKAQLKLLKTGRAERTFATSLRDHLLPAFATDGITVDAPYSKHGQSTKRLDERVIELDIAIHERFTDERNIVAIELETNNRPARDDVWKIEELTRSEGEYKYDLGLFLVVGISERAGEIIELVWYKDGEVA